MPEIVESVVVATQVGTPAMSAKTWPLVPADVVESAPEPLPKRMVLAVSVLQPVPPNEAESVEVADTTPLIAWRLPVIVPMLRDGVVSAPVALIVVVPVAPKATVFAERLVVEAPPESVVKPENVSAVEVALPGKR